MARPPKHLPESRTRWIETSYFDEKKRLIRVNIAAYAENAVTCCVKHMQTNKYGAFSADVFDSVTGRLYAVVRRYVSGNIAIIFKNRNIPKNRKSK